MQIDLIFNLVEQIGNCLKVKSLKKKEKTHGQIYLAKLEIKLICNKLKKLKIEMITFES